MRLVNPVFFFILVLLSPNKLLADPSPAKKITHPKSECIVEISAGGYPLYKVNRNGKIIYSPTSDGIIKANIWCQSKNLGNQKGQTRLKGNMVFRDRVKYARKRTKIDKKVGETSSKVSRCRPSYWFKRYICFI